MTGAYDRTPLPAEKGLAADDGRSVDVAPANHRHFLPGDVPLTLTVNAQGCVMAASPSSTRLLGFAPEALLGERIESFVHHDDHSALRVVLGVSTQDTGASHENSLHANQELARCRVRGHDGTWHKFAFSVVPLVTGSVHPMTLVTLRPCAPLLSTPVHANIEEVATGAHAVQFYETEEFLVEALTRFVQSGIDASEACVVIATRAHRAHLEARLRASGRDLTATRRDGLYVALDADKLLRTILVEDMPDPARFARAVGRVIDRARKRGRQVRLVGEVVAQLWVAGNQTAALRLEALWNELQQRTIPAFTLLCAYPVQVFAEYEQQSVFTAVSQQHAQVLPDDPDLAQVHRNEQLHAMTQLQQRAHLLQVEIAQRHLAEERLRRSERRYRSLFEGAADGILMVAPDGGRISEANPAALDLLGAAHEDVVGHELWQIGLFPDRQAALDAMRAVSERSVLRYEALSLGDDSTQRQVECVGSLIAVDGTDEQAIIQWTLRDISARKQLEREVTKRSSELEALLTVTDATLAHVSLETLVPELLERVRTALAVDNVAILLPDGTGCDLRIYLARGPEEEVAGQVRVPIGQGVAGRIASTRQPLIIDDLRVSKSVNPFLRERLRSLMGVPLLVEDRLVGVIHVATTEPHRFTETDLRVLQLVADRIALAIERTQLHQEAQLARYEAVERANQLHATIESMSDGLVVFDREGRLLEMNRTAQSLLGYDAQPANMTAAPPINWHNVRNANGQPMPPDEWPVHRVLAGEVISGAQTVDLIIQAAEGRDIQVSVSGAPVRDEVGTVLGAVCVFRDVSEPRRLERRTHDALAALLAMAGALVDLPANAEPDAKDPPVPASPVPRDPAASSAASPVAQRVAHLAREVLGCQRVSITAIEPATQLQVPITVVGLSPDHERQWWQEHHAHPSRYGERTDPELHARFEAGEALVLDMTQPPHDGLPNPYGASTILVAPLRFNSQVIGILALDYGGPSHRFTEEERVLARAVGQIVAVVIERARLLREREEARATALAEQETTHRMHTFLGIAGHELRTPVTSIKAGVQLSERALHTLLEMALPAETTRLLQRAQSLLVRADQQASRLNRLIEDILDVTRTHAGNLSLRTEVADLGAVVHQAVEAQRSSWPGREITLDMPEASVRLTLDVDRIEQVVANLLTNALKYSTDDQPVAVHVNPTPQGARVAVRDHGPGLSSEMQQHLWGLFHQVDGIRQESGSGAGLGLGLYICRSIVERHGGRVGVESAVGTGSTFWFELPLEPSLLDLRDPVATG